MYSVGALCKAVFSVYTSGPLLFALLLYHFIVSCDCNYRGKHSMSLLVIFLIFLFSDNFYFSSAGARLSCLLIKSKNCLKIKKMQKYNNKLIECNWFCSFQPAIKGYVLSYLYTLCVVCDCVLVFVRTMKKFYCLN